jgi:hypothetical protein
MTLMRMCGLLVVGLLSLPSSVSAAPSCVTPGTAPQNEDRRLILPVPSQQIAAYEAKGFVRVPCGAGSKSPENVKRAICALANSVPPNVDTHISTIFGSKPSEMCVAANEAAQEDAQ